MCVWREDGGGWWVVGLLGLILLRVLRLAAGGLDVDNVADDAGVGRVGAGVLVVVLMPEVQAPLVLALVLDM